MMKNWKNALRLARKKKDLFGSEPTTSHSVLYLSQNAIAKHNITHILYSPGYGWSLHEHLHKNLTLFRMTYPPLVEVLTSKRHRLFYAVIGMDLTTGNPNYLEHATWGCDTREELLEATKRYLKTVHPVVRSFIIDYFTISNHIPYNIEGLKDLTVYKIDQNCLDGLAILGIRSPRLEYAVRELILSEKQYTDAVNDALFDPLRIEEL